MPSPKVVALFAGTRLLDAHRHGEYGVAWVAFVVRLHFLPFSWAWRHPEFRWLGLALMTLGTVGAVLGLIGAGDASIALVAGVGSGFVLLGYAGAGGRSAGRRGEDGRFRSTHPSWVMRVPEPA